MRNGLGIVSDVMAYHINGNAIGTLKGLGIAWDGMESASAYSTKHKVSEESDQNST